MRILLIIIGVFLAICAIASAITLVPMLTHLGDSAYESGRLMGRVTITIFVSIGSIMAFQKARS